MSRVLVAYASKHGSTAEIAAAVGRAIQANGVDVDVLPVTGVTAVEPYDAVVVGSATYIMRWRGEAVDFLQRFRRGLASRPVLIFSSGPLDVPTDRDHVPASVAEFAKAIDAREIKIFAGRFDKDAPGLAERMMALANVSGDFRDWAEIAQWGETIATEVKDLAMVGTA